MCIRDRLYSAGTYAYIESTSTTNSTITLRKSASGADSIDYIQCRDNSNALKYKVGGSGNVEANTVNANTFTSAGSVLDSKGDVRKIPLNNQTSAYVPVASDSGKVITISTGGITINTNVMLVGDVITIINNSGSDQTITQGSGFTMYNSGDGSTGNRTLGARGMATLWYGADDWGYISGAGLS